MGFRIKPQEIEPVRKGGPVKDASYLAFIRELPCCLTGRYIVEAAHLSLKNHLYGHVGRGKGQKASDRWALPLDPDLHREQHKIGETMFWYEINRKEPHLLALILWGLWSEMGWDAKPFAVTAINQWRMM